VNESIIYLDGEFVPKSQALVSVFDHGYLYGDGIFEGIRAYAGNVFCLEEHLDRLYESAKSILLDIPLTQAEMQEAVVATLRANEMEEGYIRLVVSRGFGNLGLHPGSCTKASVVIIAEKMSLFPSEYYEVGLDIISSSFRRNSADVLNPRIKSLNYLNSVLVKLEASRQGVLEALVLNREGYVTEGSGDNVFIVKNGRVLTPPTYLGCLEGITRNVVIELLAELGIPCEERPFTMHDVYISDEVFLTGTAAEIIPAVTCDGRRIGDGKPGKITAAVTEAFRKLTPVRGVAIQSQAKERDSHDQSIGSRV